MFGIYFDELANDISITLRAGATIISICLAFISTFQSTPLRGGDEGRYRIPLFDNNFNSPCAGATNHRHMFGIYFDIFNPRPPARGATINCYFIVMFLRFQSTPPALGGRPGSTGGEKVRTIYFQSTPPARGDVGNYRVGAYAR